MPSLASVFPFLGSICPQEFQTWHISRAQLLHHYDCAWVLHSINIGPSCLTLVSLGDERSDVERLDMDGKTYFLILFPRFWDRKKAKNKWTTICNRLFLSDETGCIISKPEFEGMSEQFNRFCSKSVSGGLKFQRLLRSGRRTCHDRTCRNIGN